MRGFLNLKGRARWAVPAAGVLSLVFILTFGGFLNPGARAAQEAQPLPVDTVIVAYESGYTVTRAYAGRIDAGRVAEAGFDQGGLVAVVDADEGDVVKQGERVAALDVRRLTAARDQADAQVTSARASLKLAEATLVRQSDLAAQDFSSRQRLDEAQANRDAAAADLARARADLAAAEAALELAEIRAPFDAQVARRFVDEGDVVAAGEPVVTLVEAGARELRVALPAETARALAPGDMVRVRIGAHGPILSAPVERLVDAVDPETRTRLAVIGPIARENAPEPGAVVRVLIERRVDERGFWAPVTALAEGSRGLWRVMAVDPEAGAAVVHPRPVEVLHVEGERAYLRGAAQEGDHIVAEGVGRVAPGQKVRESEARVAARR